MATTKATELSQLSSALQVDESTGEIIFTGSLSVDSNTLFIDGDANRVGIGTLTPGSALDVAGNLTTTGGNISCGGFDFRLGGTDQVTRGDSGESRALVKGSGTKLVVNFANDFTGGTEVESDLKVDGNLETTGILDVGGERTFLGNDGGGTHWFGMREIAAGEPTNLAYGIATDGSRVTTHQWRIDGSQRMLIDSSGNVGIGTSSPSNRLEVSGAGRFQNLRVNAAESAKIELLQSGSTVNAKRTDLISASESFVIQSRDENDNFISNDLQGYKNDFGVSLWSFRITGSEAMRIDSSGNVGIGTSSPSTLLNLSTSDPRIRLDDTDTGGTFEIRNTSGVGYISTLGAHPLRFSTNSSEAMRIDPSGDLLVGTTLVNSAQNNTSGCVLAGAGQLQASISGTPLALNRIDSDGFISVFRRSANIVGTISVTSSSTSYNTSSDYRLKENVTELSDGIERLKHLPVHRFNFIADPEKTVDGFIAHEVQPYVPEAVTGEKDAVDEDGNPEYQGIDQAKLVPVLTAALQEAVAEIESLKERVTQLENGTGS